MPVGLSPMGEYAPGGKGQGCWVRVAGWKVLKCHLSLASGTQ